MGRYDKHQGRVGRAQGATTLFIGDDGYFDIGDVKGGTNGTQFAGRKLQLMNLADTTQTFIALSVNSLVTISQISPAYGYINIGGAGSNPVSVQLPTASAGAYLVINLGGQLCTTQIKASGLSLAGYRNSDLSRISVVQGNVVELACFTDGCWSVVYTSGSAIESPSA